MRSNIIITAAKILLTIGFALCLGSIASFIAMNVINGEMPGIQFSYWQRTFVNPIMNFVTIPGMWLFLFSNILLFFTGKDKNSRTGLILLILSVLIFINGQFVIVPIAGIVNDLAIQQNSSSIILQEYASKKSAEDFAGGINMLLFLSHLVLYIKNESIIRNKLIRRNDLTRRS